MGLGGAVSEGSLRLPVAMQPFWNVKLKEALCEPAGIVTLSGKPSTSGSIERATVASWEDWYWGRFMVPFTGSPVWRLLLLDPVKVKVMFGVSTQPPSTLVETEFGIFPARSDSGMPVRR